MPVLAACPRIIYLISRTDFFNEWWFYYFYIRRLMVRKCWEEVLHSKFKGRIIIQWFLILINAIKWKIVDRSVRKYEYLLTREEQQESIEYSYKGYLSDWKSYVMLSAYHLYCTNSVSFIWPGALARMGAFPDGLV